jgi:uncharacterized DUF497 family protein
MYKFEWDEDKHKLNMQKHKLSFEHVPQLFAKPIHVINDNRIDYKEKRYIGFQELDGRLMVVVFTIRKSNVIRVISFRKANNREQKEYKNKLG